MLRGGIWGNPVPVLWEIALHESCDLLQFTEQVASVLEGGQSLEQTVHGIRGRHTVTPPRDLVVETVGSLLECPQQWSKHPHVSLLYIGSQTVQMAAASNGLLPEEFQAMHDKIKALEGTEVEFHLDGVVANSRVVVARAQLPSHVPCAQSPPSMILALRPNIAAKLATDLFLGARQLYRIEPPFRMRGTIQLVKAEARSPVQEFYALTWEDDLLGILEENAFPTWHQYSTDGRAHAMSNGSLFGKGIFHVQVSAGQLSGYLRDRVLQACTDRWALDKSTLRALTTKGGDGSRVATEAGIFLNAAKPLREQIISLGKARRGTPSPNLDPHLLELWLMAQVFGTMVISFEKQVHRHSLRLLLCSIRKRSPAVYKVQSIWQRIAQMLDILSERACSGQSLEVQVRARAARALAEARERQQARENVL